MPSFLGLTNISHSSEEGAPKEFLVSVPCWSEVPMDENPDMVALEGLQLRKRGKGNHFAACAIKVDLVFEEILLLPSEENRPISGGLPASTLE